MSFFKVELKKSAEKEMLKIPKDFVDSLSFKLKNLSENPFPEGMKKLKGSDNM